MKNLIVASMLTFWAVTSAVLCISSTASPDIPIDNGISVQIIEPDTEFIEYKLEQEELESNTNHWVNHYPLLYDIPLSGQVQHHIKDVCKEYDVDMELVLAIIQKESRYDSKAISADGLAYGLMQIVTICHKDRMDKLEVTDILNEYQNVEVGIDILAELLSKYDTNYALMCYNMGEGRAAKCGKTETAYTREIMQIKESIHELKFNDDSQATKRNQWKRVQATIQ